MNSSAHYWFFSISVAYLSYPRGHLGSPAVLWVALMIVLLDSAAWARQYFSFLLNSTEHHQVLHDQCVTGYIMMFLNVSLAYLDCYYVPWSNHQITSYNSEFSV